MTKIKLNKIALKNTTMVRPSHALGTCGYYPKAWQIAPVKRGQSLTDAFLSVNHNWKVEELTQ